MKIKGVDRNYSAVAKVSNANFKFILLNEEEKNWSFRQILCAKNHHFITQMTILVELVISTPWLTILTINGLEHENKKETDNSKYFVH